MDPFFEILKIILPAALVFIAIFFTSKRFLENEDSRRTNEMRQNSQNLLTPLRLQAYERIVIFLERIHPDTLVVRVNKHGMTAQQLHQELIKTIKTEYEHNISQQIYVSYGAWELVKTTKEEIIKLINISSTKIAHDKPGNELAMMILNISSNLGKKLPNDVALEYIKKEVGQKF